MSDYIDSIGEALQEIGGVKPTDPFRTMLYAQGILDKRGVSMDQAAEHLRKNYPEFNISSEDDLWMVIKRDREEVYKEVVSNNFVDSSFAEFFEKAGFPLWDAE